MVVLDFLREKGKAPMRLAHFANPSRRQAKGFLLPIAGLLAVLMIAACNGAATTPNPSPTVAPAFPVTLTGDDGKTVTLEAKPQKIVSLMPGATETLFAIGAGPRVVGKVEDIAKYPPEAASVPVVATYQGVDVEKIVGLNPDLVIVGSNGGTPQDAIDQLHNLNLPVLAIYASDVEGVLKDIELTGQATGDGDAAQDLTASMRSQFDQVAAATKSIDKPRVFYETGNEPALYGVADDSFVSSMIALAGAQPLTTGSSTNWEMPQEKLIAADPQVILLGDAAYGVSATDVVARPGWSTLTAVKDSAIYSIDDIVVTRPGPRLAAGLAALVAAIHPDIVLATATP
jgi:iron complex transport system substrate-binding protein